MAPIKRLKKVSWAPDPQLRQEHLFLSEDAPALSGLDVQEKLQAKGSWLWHSTESPSGDNLSPGYGGPRSILNKKKETTEIPSIKWCCPHRLVLDPQWLVVAGEESEEVKAQRQMQFTSLEAIYPRPSSIPPNPCVSSVVQNTYYDDAETPLIPIIADEEQPDPDPFFSTPVDFSESEQPPDVSKILSKNDQLSSPTKPKQIFGNIPGVESDIVAAASLAFTATVKSSDKGSLIDREILIKILSDPNMIEKLLLQSGALKQAPPPQVVAPTSNPSPQIGIGNVSPICVPPGPLSHIALPHTAETTTVPALPGTTSQPKEEYYKSLIQKHGTMESLDHQSHIQKYDAHGYTHHKRDLVGCHTTDPPWKQQISRQRLFHSKPCAFFNSPRGCRNGSKCTFMHDVPSSQMQLMTDTDSRKKIKMDI